MSNPSSCAGEVAEAGMKGLADSFARAATWALKTLTTEWMKVPSPNLMAADSPIAWLEGHLVYFVWVAMFCSVLVAAYRMVTTNDHRHGLELAKSLMRLTIISGTLAIVVTLALSVGDAVAGWLLDQVTLSDTTALLIAGLAGGTGASPIPDAFRFVLAGVVVLAQLVQLGLMVLKNSVVIVLVAFIPLTAAVTNTSRGFGGYEKALTYLGAWVLYKPVAAALYALAFKMLDATQGVSGMVSGVMLMVLAIFALPTMIKVIAPVAASAAGGNAGAIAGAVVGASLATGAVILTGGMGAGGFAGAAGSSGGRSSAGSGALANGAAAVASIPPPTGSNHIQEAVSND